MPETEGRWVPGVEPGHATGKSKEELQRRITGTTLIRRDKERTCLRQPEYFQQYLRQASRCARRSIAAAQTERRHARQRGMGQYPWGSLVLRESSSHSNFQLRFVLRPKAAPPSRCHKYNGFQSSILDNGFQSSILDNGFQSGILDNGLQSGILVNGLQSGILHLRR